MRATGTPRTSGLRGLSTVKSYHSTPPPGRTQRHMVCARRHWNGASSSDENTVDCITMSSLSSGSLTSDASPCISVTPAGSVCIAWAKRSGSSSMPTRLRGAKPRRSSSSRLSPLPQPTSSTRRVDRSFQPNRTNRRSIARCRSCSVCHTWR